VISTLNLALTLPLTRHGYGESLYDSGNTYRGNWVALGGLTRRPPSAAAAPHCPPCHSHGPGRPVRS
jgi:hypothetical protein